jgi:uncharacterized protein (DUF433 family)
MNILREVERLLPKMTPGEKAQLLQWIVQDLGENFPGIDIDSDICDGAPYIIRTRIPVWVLVRARQLGTKEAEILLCYPSLRAEDLTHAWAYYRAHQDQIEQQIKGNEEA